MNFANKKAWWFLVGLVLVQSFSFNRAQAHYNGRVASICDLFFKGEVQSNTELLLKAKSGIANTGNQNLASAKSFELRRSDEITELKVATYNVENLFLIASDQVTPGNSRKPLKPTEKVQDLAKVILELDSDILILQEVGGLESLEVFSQDYLHGLYQPYLVSGNDHRGIEIAFLVKKDLPLDFRIESNRHEAWIDERSGTANVTKLFSRDLPVLLAYQRGFSTKPEAKPVLAVFGVHYKSKRASDSEVLAQIDPTSNIVREKQVERTIEIVGRYRLQYGKHLPALIAGDFNGDVNNEAMFKNFQTILGFENSFDLSESKIKQSSRYTHAYFSGGSKQPPQLAQLDAIFLANQLSDLVIKTSVIRYRDWQTNRIRRAPSSRAQHRLNPSDHWPVELVLDFQKLLIQPKKRGK